MVITFPTPVTLAAAQVTQGTGTASSTTVSNNQVFVNLTGVANAETIQVTLAGGERRDRYQQSDHPDVDSYW